MEHIEQILMDFMERPLPEVRPRTTVISRIPGKASVVVGMRRSGKTCLLFGEMHRLLEEGVDRRSMLYANFEDDRIHPMEEDILSRMLDTFFRLHPEARTEGAYIFLDEIQAVVGWPRFLRRLLDTENINLYVTGSSARLLSREVSVEFGGRGVTTELLPLSFTEVLLFQGESPPSTYPGARTRSMLENRLDSYLKTGGFPALLDATESQRIQMLQDYVELVLLRDVMERHGTRNTYAVKSFSRALLQSAGALASVNRLSMDLHSRGIHVGKNTLYELLGNLEDSFLLFAIPIFSRSLRVRESNPRKIYAVDPGLAFAMAPAGTSNVGRRLENAVYLELRRRLECSRSATICYYITNSGYEVDLVYGDEDLGQASGIIQVCADLTAPETRMRELRALGEAMEELNVPEGAIVTLHERDRIEIRGRTVHIIPAWEWLLGLASPE
jgi:predicted AAA+ superfamily ATPase